MRLRAQWLLFFYVIFAGCSFVQSDKQPQSMPATDAVLAKSALLSDQINDVAADENSIWVATDQGVNRFTKGENYWYNYPPNLDGKLRWIFSQLRCYFDRKIRGIV